MGSSDTKLGSLKEGIIPVVKQVALNSNRITVKCPLCSGNVRIARDASAWINHMVTTHSAVAASFTTGTEHSFQEGMTDSDNPVLKYANKCYGDGSTFSSAALLITHLSSVHSAS